MMKLFIAALLLAACTLGGCGGGMMMGGFRNGAQQAPPARTWSCPSCGGSYATQGNCPKCGTTMVELGGSAVQPGAK